MESEDRRDVSANKVGVVASEENIQYCDFYRDRVGSMDVHSVLLHVDIEEATLNFNTLGLYEKKMLHNYSVTFFNDRMKIVRMQKRVVCGTGEKVKSRITSCACRL